MLMIFIVRFTTQRENPVVNSRFETAGKQLKTSHLQTFSSVPKSEQRDEIMPLTSSRWYECCGLVATEDRRLDIDRVLSELKRERKQLDHAIAALEAIRKQGAKKSRAVRQTKARIKSAVPRRTRAVGTQFGKSENVIRFPRLRRSGS
jgi:hypothetical protein